MPINLKNKRVLVLNLGLLGGGVATTNWLLGQGARVTVTDLTTDPDVLAPSVKRVEDHLKKIARDGKAYEKLRARLAWSLGTHSGRLVDAADILVVNPSVSVSHPYVKRALAAGKKLMNEGTLFYDRWPRKLVGITGTRGKTTTTHWTHHLIKGSVQGGNSAAKPFQTLMDARGPVAVTELSSFILELFPYSRRAPDVAVITNLYQDHLNRHDTMEGYARAKAAIFARQRSGGSLVLNADSEWTAWFLGQEPKAQPRFFSLKPLAAEQDGIWDNQGRVMERVAGKDRAVLEVHGFAQEWGAHNLSNLLAAALAARLVGVPWSTIQGRIATLPAVPYRQEVVHRSHGLTVVNDTTATSPDGGIAALRRWGGPNCILIAGGTDRDLDYRAWATELPVRVTKNNLIFMDGSATRKMRVALGKAATGVRTYDTLEAAWGAARKRASLFVHPIIVFSPAAKSFESFQNEFDRGAQFNALVERDLGRKV